MFMKELPHKGYFEGILQLRNPTDELIDYVKRKVLKDDKAAITMEKTVRGGFDLYFSSQRYLRALGKKLPEVFTGSVKFSRSLHTISKSTGKPLYRVTVLFKLLPFKKGNTFDINQEEWTIMRVDNKVHVMNKKSGKKKTLTFDEVSRFF